jgi:hypothetical protein
MSVLSFGSYLKLNIVLQTSEHEGFQNQVQPSKLMLVDLSLVCQRVLFNVLREPFLELLMGVEELRHDKVEKGPQLCHRVLDRSTSQEESVSCIELKQYLPPSTQVIFYSLRLIENHIMPLYSQ